MNAGTVKAIRLSQNMSQQDFADALRVSRQCITAVECGYRAVSSNLRIRIAQTFGTGPDIVEAIERAKESEKLAL
ncbi:MULTISPECIES: helix-turn-helix transcriptional regulator [Paenibacillus]|uniref:helix-turn-helix transcriptional regulator n=1 Tax=Paenibacillus TaxID=44249 RepID=UPI000BA5FD71|nr:helix-turn-helix transcriptional regulator [Paenibacillus sp. 7541]MCM3497669.1 helix-turn-helix transcriptional regulator [Paenibacillus lactis]PAK55413.1 transcriptional regulator [Paenibacillus sp. 7541]